MLDNKPDVIDSTINDLESLVNKHKNALTNKEYETSKLINYRLMDKIFIEISSSQQKRPFIVDKRGSKYFNFKMENTFHLVHLNIETAKKLIEILIENYGWKRVDITYSQTTKIIEMDIYQHYDKDLLSDDLKINKYMFTESSDTFRLRFIHSIQQK